jgi:sec-independent protein translocase protein TatA
MGFDDPVVIILILGVAVLLFGAGRIPAFARSLGQARKEFEKATKGSFEESPKIPTVAAATEKTIGGTEDPLIEAAEKEGIDTHGKTKQEIASALSWKLSKVRE